MAASAVSAFSGGGRFLGAARVATFSLERTGPPVVAVLVQTGQGLL